MENSSGPTTSTSDAPPLSPENLTECTKKKKNRRKPRQRDKKKNKEKVANEDILNNDLISLEINSIKDKLNAVFYRRHVEGHIKIHSFIKDGFIPRVFYSNGHRPSHDSVVLKKISDLSINGVVKKSVPAKVKRQKPEKAQKNQKDENYPDYLSIEEVEKGLADGSLIKGYIRINMKNHNVAYVGNENVSKLDYFINSIVDRNRALNGDEVVLRLKAEENNDKKTLSEVVYITKKIHPRMAVGCLTPSIAANKRFAIFSPRDRGVPKIKIPKISWPSEFESKPKLYEEILFVAKITDWKESKYPIGTIIENLGISGDLKVESLAILREFCLDPAPYGADIKRFLPKSTQISEEEFSYREDLRKECIFTIDPLTARDLDDAVSCKALPNGNFEIGVHISDASFYLLENTKLDDQVRNKATTIYMVDSVYHMLPVELCLFCSLLPNEDKLAFSVFWEMTSSGEVVKKRCARTVINSCVQLAYEHAQMMIDDPQREFSTNELPEIFNEFTAKDLSQVVNDLQKIAVCLREKRMENGSLKIDQVKLGFTLDPKSGKPEGFHVYENKPANRLIEEFMLLANMTVAQCIYDAFPDVAFLRLHEPPKPTMMEELKLNLETIGMHFDITSSGGIQSSLNKYYSDDFLGRTRMAVLNHLFAKPMKRARYFCTGALQDEELSFNHFALSIPIYTHFTSPIRRYADIMVHRLLAASLNYRVKPDVTPKEVEEIAETCNRQKYHAKKAGEASSDLYLAHYIEQHQPYVAEAVVVDVREKFFDVIVLSTGSIVRIYIDKLGDGVKYKSEEIKSAQDEETNKKMWRILLSFPKTSKDEEAVTVLEIFTVVLVELTRKPKTNTLEAKLIRPVKLTL